MAPKVWPLFCWLLSSLAAAHDSSDLLQELRTMHARIETQQVQIETQQVRLQSQIADLHRQQFVFKQRLAGLSFRGESPAVNGAAAADAASELKADQGRSLSAALAPETIEDLQAHIEELENSPIKVALLSLVQVEAGTRECIDYVWLLICGALVMSMQAGFAVLEAGTCRKSSAGMILLKNIMDAAMGAIVWWWFGMGLAYGTVDPNEFVGTSNFFGGAFETSSAGHRDWFFQWAFCATAATIVSGAVAERIQFQAYIICAGLLTAFIYPVVVHWTWSGEGFLTKLGYSDFAGSGVVHLTGGTAAFVAAAILGPRAGRFEEGVDIDEDNRFVPNDLAMVVLGTLLLWFGWYGFNCGSTLSISTPDAAQAAALVAVNTTLSAAAGGLTVIGTRRLVTGKLDMARSCNGILVGLVAVCAACDAMDPGMALVTGSLGGFAMVGGSFALLRLKIDDPLDAVSVHGCGGIVGVLLRPLVDSAGVQWDMMGAQILGIVCIVAWTGILIAALFLALKRIGMLNVSEDEQRLGSDLALLNLDATPEEASANPEHEAPHMEEGVVVVVRESFMSSNKGSKQAFYKFFDEDLRGVVTQMDSDGDAQIDFGKHGKHWVIQKHFINLRSEDPEAKADDSRRQSLEPPMQKDISACSVSSTGSPNTERPSASRQTSSSLAEDDQDRQRSLEKRSATSEDGETLSTTKSEKSGQRSRRTSARVERDDVEPAGPRSLAKRSEDCETASATKSEKSSERLHRLPARVDSDGVEPAAPPRKQKRPPRISVDDASLAR